MPLSGFDIPALDELQKDADHVDVKSFACDKPLALFLSKLINYKPGWVRALFRVRGMLARLVALHHEGTELQAPQPSDIDFTPGSAVSFFTTTAGDPKRHWIGNASETHLNCALAVVKDVSTMHVITVVHYNNWLGPVYFNLIRPFHHLLVYAMGRHAARS